MIGFDFRVSDWPIGSLDPLDPLIRWIDSVYGEKLNDLFTLSVHLLKGSIIDLNSEMGTVNLTSPGYPSCNFPSHFQREWIVRATHGLKVSVEVIGFGGETRVDSVTFGDGDDSAVGSSVLAELQSTNKIHVVTSRDSWMWIQLETGPQKYGVDRWFYFQIQQLNDTSGKLSL